MSIPVRLTDYLHRHGIHYDVRAHRPSHCSFETARTAHIPVMQLAKSVVLEDENGWVMALVPADQNIMLGRVSRLLHRQHLHLADEEALQARFDDCAPGAVPSVGMAWNIDTMVDEALDSNDVVYLESGDHERLLCLSREEFQQLMSEQQRGQFTEPHRRHMA